MLGLFTIFLISIYSVSCNPPNDSLSEPTYKSQDFEEVPHSNFASSSDLTSLAHSSAAQAKNALQNQETAGNQANYQVKSTLAEAAQGAAGAAKAALVGKQVLIQELQQQLEKADYQLKTELAQYQQAEESAKSAQGAAHAAQRQVNTITAALIAAQSTAAHTNQAAATSSALAASQHSMIIQAKQKVDLITAQLAHSLNELNETEGAAQKAHYSAQIAQANAAQAGHVFLVQGHYGGYH